MINWLWFKASWIWMSIVSAIELFVSKTTPRQFQFQVSVQDIRSQSQAPFVNLGLFIGKRKQQWLIWKQTMFLIPVNPVVTSTPVLIWVHPFARQRHCFSFVQDSDLKWLLLQNYPASINTGLQRNHLITIFNKIQEPRRSLSRPSKYVLRLMWSRLHTFKGHCRRLLFILRSN